MAPRALDHRSSNACFHHGLLDFNDLHRGYGFGIHVHTRGETFFKIDLAKSVEGFVVHFGNGLGF